MTRRFTTLVACVGLLWGTAAQGADKPPTKKEVDELEQRVEQQNDVIRDLEKRLEQIEGTAPESTPPVAAPPPEERTGMPESAEEIEARMYPETQQSPVQNRGTFEDRQEAAARPGNLVLDPQYRGFIPIPRTVFMVKFNPKPRLDLMWTTRNPGGSRYRFAPALFPIDDNTFGNDFDAGSQFDAGANGSQIRVDLRAPALGGNFRLYYQNDFFGEDDSHMQYRLQHLYGQFHGVVGGFTYSLWEDPDSWPDTVDYEGPNSVIFARRPVLHYTRQLTDEWNFTVGIEDPNVQIDTTTDTTASERQNAPDGGFNIRWEPGDFGHLQFSTLVRSLATRSDVTDHESDIGWGVNLGGSIAITDDDTMQFLGVVGEGVGGLGNDSGFENTDAAFDSSGDLEALPYQSGMIAFTHKWTDDLRSTGTFGYVHVDNTSVQLPNSYNETYYGSFNFIYQLYKRLSIGVEGLYGFREVNNGDDSDDVVRIHVGLVYSPFD
jgi:DcaP outer membrane protein